MKGRLPEEFRQRMKRYAAEVIRLLVKLPKEREEIRVLLYFAFSILHCPRAFAPWRLCVEPEFDRRKNARPR